MSFIDTKGIDVVILCGGRGKRLRSAVKDRPKPMAEIDNHPFLDLLIDYVGSFGFRRFILCVGYLGNIIKKYYQNKRKSFEINFSEENRPLGTAGAVKNADSLIKSSPFLVLNGDSFCALNLQEFIKFHIKKQSELSLALVKMKQCSDYGIVEIDDSKRIVKFSEKENKIKRKNSLSNAGIYLFNDSIISLIPPNKFCSLESDLFPKLTPWKCYGYVTKGFFIDIGIPDRYKRAKQILLKTDLSKNI